MNIFKRITASFTGSIESAVSQLENHEAVVQAALKDTQTMAAKAKVRLARVQQDGVALEQRLASLQQAEKSWGGRALQLKESDESKALECVRRRNRCRDEIEASTNALAQHKQQEQSLIETVKRIEKRLGEIEQTRNMLRTRQTAAEVQRAVAKLESNSSLDLDDVLERWKMRILETEYTSPIIESKDSFEADFEEKENLAELKVQLDKLGKEE